MSLSLRALRVSRVMPLGMRASSTSTASASAPAPTPAEPNTEPLPSVEELRSKAKKVYKELHRLGRE